MYITKHTLSELRNSAGMKDPVKYEANIRRLLLDAEEAMNTDRISVMDNPNLPASGNPHDYYSVGPYYWPNPDTPDGLPYVARDGEFNPEFELCDRRRMDKICKFTRTLTLAYAATGNEKYRTHAVKLLNCFFIDEDTKVNPHLEYAQEIRGKNTGRSIGIIDIRYFYRMLDMIRVLDCPELDGNLKKWMADMLVWLRTSEKGIQESHGTNNHGCWYDVTCASIALYVGETEYAKEVIRNFEENRIFAQVADNGGMPRELKRTRSFLYSTMNLYSFFTAASLGETLGIDLFGSEKIRSAFEFMLPSYKDYSVWTYPQIAENWEETWEQAYEVLLLAGEKFGKAEECRKAADEIVRKYIPDSDIVFFN